MNKVKALSIVLLVLVLMTVGALKIYAKSDAERPIVTIRQKEPQVVLYTIHRGGYDTTGITIGKLFALATRKGIMPRGEVSYAYLNNPAYVSSDHVLTEVRISVSKEALAHAGTLGKITDVKALRAMEMAVAIKPEGQADPLLVYQSLHNWILKQGYIAAEGPVERFLTNAESGNYTLMKSEIMIPIEKPYSDKD